VTPTPLTTDLLAELVAKKHDLLVQLRDVGLRQVELIDGGDMTQLLKLLSSKQRLLNGLQAVERQLDPFRRENPASRVWRSPADREACSRQAALCETLLAEVVERERRSESNLIAHRDRVAVELEVAHRAAEAHHAYDENRLSVSRQLDLSSEG
jgi:hypothetical protein